MKGFGTLYVFELKKVLGQRLLLVSVLLGAALLFGWSLLTFYGTGYYYRYDAQTNSVEQFSRPYCEVEALRRNSMRALSGRLLDESLMEELIGQYRDDASGTPDVESQYLLPLSLSQYHGGPHRHHCGGVLCHLSAHL